MYSYLLHGRKTCAEKNNPMHVSFPCAGGKICFYEGFKIIKLLCDDTVIIGLMEWPFFHNGEFKNHISIIEWGKANVTQKLILQKGHLHIKLGTGAHVL